ncbi:hypothetical protein GOBAR_DD23425 [Gossypium barbadense]|nr:hypothetical protein GOBAR_DD23425 [Gossypium barbadense]
MSRRSIPLLRQLWTLPSFNLTPTRSVTYMPRPGDGAPRAVTLIPGDGIGPLVTGAVEQVMEAMHAPLYFERYEVHGDMERVPEEVIQSIKKNKVCLKGGLATPMGGVHQDVDIVVIRENTEGEYSGLEHEVVPGVVESLKLITKFCSERIAKYAFEYAYLNNRKKVTAVHKANIMKLADGLFLESCREVSTKYPGIKYNEIIVDNCCMQLVSKPEQFDVMSLEQQPRASGAKNNEIRHYDMVTPNLYGNLVANTAAGIAGGTGFMPGGYKILLAEKAMLGLIMLFSSKGASAGNVGNVNLVEQKKANPVALLLSSAMMLRHLQFPSFADRLETAVERVISDGKYRTKDLGGTSTTQEVIDAVIAALD